MPTENDPLAEETGPCTTCERGWVTVKPGYALHLYPDPTMEQLADLDEEQQAKLWATTEEHRRAAANSVYPCRRCRPAMFYRWAGGHFRPGHDPLACDECTELMGGKRAAQRAARALPVTTPRRDLDD